MPYIIRYTILVLLASSLPLFAAPQPIRQWLEKAEFYFRGGNLKAAGTHLEQARSVAPDDPDVVRLSRLIAEAKAQRVDAALRSARFYQSAGNLPDAEKQYREVLAIDPSNTDARQGLEGLQKVKDTVEKYQETGVSVAPSTGRAYDVVTYSLASLLLRAQAAFGRGDLDTADMLLTDLLKREPTHGRALELKARIGRLREINALLASLDSEFGKGDYFAAVTALDKLLKEFPGRPDLLLKRGKALLKANRPLEALRDLEQLVATSPLPPDLLPALADAYDSAEMPLKAAAVAGASSAGVRVKPLHRRLILAWKAYPVSGSLLILSLLLLPAALFWAWLQFDRLSERHPPGRLFSLTHLFLRAALFGIPDTHVEAWTTLAKHAGHPWLAYVAGLLLLRQGDTAAAQEPLQKALESSALAPRAYFFLGILRARLGQSVAAHDLEQSLLAAFRGIEVSFLPRFLSRLEREVAEQACPAAEACDTSIENLSRQAALELFSQSNNTTQPHGGSI
ncbi:tetratricopeptide repeat protein [Candidatus Ozemobacteraceae bacterium]|nr:tetratricopeptide repeat protein [Candidatus Ozemobacteraceae bacterium]